MTHVKVWCDIPTAVLDYRVGVLTDQKLNILNGLAYPEERETN